MTGDDFLSRWSRRKREVRREEEEEAAPPPVPADASPDETEPELSPEEIEALPKIEELTPETDITVFLRKGVPEILRNAALRRMWTLDPAIRDYVSEAREYAYDWNVPGGVPGNGPLLPSDDVGKMLAGIFGDPRPADAPREEALDLPLHQGEPEKGDAAASDEPQIAQASAPQEGFVPETAHGQAEGDDPSDHSDAAPQNASAPDTPSTRPRRHGGAVPV